MKFFPGTTNLFDDMLDDMFTSPFFTNRSDMVMKTDITEKDGYYTLDMELPGCKKEDIHLELKDGYLNVSAARNANKDEKDAKGNLVRQERYSGTFSRSFYVGDKLSEEDIKAGYENGELKITFPKEVKKLPEKKTITIETSVCGRAGYNKIRMRQEAMNMEYVTLNNGVKMPMAGIGTFLLSPDEAEASWLRSASFWRSAPMWSCLPAKAYRSPYAKCCRSVSVR